MNWQRFTIYDTNIYIKYWMVKMNSERVKEKPRISINKLGEYLVATPLRRRSIISEQKRPKTYQVIYYQSASDAIAKSISSNGIKYDLLAEESDKLMKLEPMSEPDEYKYQSNIEAIDSFLNICDDLPLEDMKTSIGQSDPPKITVAGVEISIRPELILSKTHNNENLVSVLKLYFSKNSPLDKIAGQYIATLLHKYAQKYLLDLGNPNIRLAIVIDVFAEKFYTAPASYKRRMDNIEAACKEIQLIWPTV